MQVLKEHSLWLKLISFLVGLGFLFIWIPCASCEPVLYWGSQGDWVYALQQRLYDWGYYAGPVDGVFGNATSDAVGRLQLAGGLTPDGVVGASTWGALGLATDTALPTSGGGVTDQDSVYLLAHLIAGEATGEPFASKVGVAAVVLNRMRDPAFPHTIAGVVYQPDAFESVTNGLFNRDVSQEDVQAAVDALSGWDPSGGAIYFWNPYKPVTPWIWTRTIITQIGQEVFAR